jgi:NDP-sugar pyrophosphorylase family protein
MKYAIFLVGGKGQRFETAGYSTQKSFIEVLGKSQLEWSILSCLQNYPDAQILIGCRDGLYKECLKLVGLLELRMSIKIEIINVGTATKGAAHTVEIVLNCIIDDEGDFDFVVLDNDVALKLDGKPKFQNSDAGVVITNSSNPAHSYVHTDDYHFVTRIAEKVVISHQGVVGNYYFGSKCKYLEQYKKVPSTLDEKYLSNIIGEMLKSGAVIRAEESTMVVSYGTPEEISQLNKEALYFLLEEK